MRVDIERHRRRVPGLASDLDHAAAFMDQQRDEAVAEIVRASTLQADGATGGDPSVPVPGLPGGVVPDAATQEALAYEAGITTGTLSLIERGQSNPAWGTVMAIARALGVQIGELATFVDKLDG